MYKRRPNDAGTMQPNAGTTAVNCCSKDGTRAGDAASCKPEAGSRRIFTACSFISQTASGCTGLCRLFNGVSRPRKRTAAICALAQGLQTRPGLDEEEPREWETKCTYSLDWIDSYFPSGTDSEAHAMGFAMRFAMSEYPVARIGPSFIVVLVAASVKNCAEKRWKSPRRPTTAQGDALHTILPVICSCLPYEV